nr:MAG TPA: hypothetical protein [Caudoviricetes sp.]
MKMEKIKAALAALINEDNFETVTSDKGTLKWDGDEAIKVGDVVTIVAEDGSETSAEDGEYVTAELKIEIEGGAVKSIEEIEKDEKKESTDEETVEEDNFAKKRVEAFELSYNERERKIYDVIRAKLGDDVYFYIPEAGDNYAIVAIYDEDYTEKLYRYELEWDGDEVKVVGDAQEVKSAYIPVDEDAPLKEETKEEGFEEEKPVEEKVDEVKEDVTAVEEKQDDVEERLKAIEDRLEKVEEALKNIEPAKAEEQYAAINSFSEDSKKDQRLKKMFNL